MPLFKKKPWHNSYHWLWVAPNKQCSGVTFVQNGFYVLLLSPPFVKLWMGSSITFAEPWALYLGSSKLRKTTRGWYQLGWARQTCAVREGPFNLERALASCVEGPLNSSCPQTRRPPQIGGSRRFPDQLAELPWVTQLYLGCQTVIARADTRAATNKGSSGRFWVLLVPMLGTLGHVGEVHDDRKGS